MRPWATSARKRAWRARGERVSAVRRGAAGRCHRPSASAKSASQGCRAWRPSRPARGRLGQNSPRAHCGELFQWHGQSCFAAIISLLVENKLVLLHGRLEIVLNRVPGIHLSQIGQQQVAEGRLGSWRGMHAHLDQRLRSSGWLAGPGKRNEGEEGQRAAHENKSRHGVTRNRETHAVGFKNPRKTTVFDIYDNCNLCG